jgi:5-methyltetrahydropteroyltriglutamate--homocysteine methyltransferase
MATATNLGFPRIGAHRELKRAVEGYWNGDLTKDELLESARALRASHWTEQRDLGLDVIPSNDFSYYDQVLDTCAMVGAVPERFPDSFRDGDTVDLDTYFAMARGLQEKDLEDEGSGVQAMEMTKWFDTNYHYIVPEFSRDTTFSLSSTKPVDEYEEAKAQGIETRPVLIGPVSFLLLGKTQEEDLDALDLLDDLLPVYAEVLRELAEAGAEAVQLDEPNLVLDLTDEERAAFTEAYEALADAADLDLHVATYFGDLEENLPTALELPIDALHLDLTRGEGQLADALDYGVPEDLSLSLGVIDGRNVWRADLDALLETVETATRALGTDRVMVGPSCSLLHVPVDLDTEPALSDDMKRWFAFATQKVEEIVALAERADGDEAGTEALFEKSRQARAARAESDWINDDSVQDRVAGIDAAMTERDSAHAQRAPLQREALDLPTLPTTTIGSFPQTDDVRRMRAKYKKDEISQDEYEAFIEEQIADTIAAQEEIGLDVLVHGESERGDMVEYFGRQLDGFLFTENGWVQSYGSRCVRPPIIAGDVSRPEPMTTRWLAYANDQTDQPVKGMLTGPVTMLQWSFVRGPRHPRRGARPRGGGHPGHPDRRARLPRGPAPAREPVGKLSRLGRRVLPARLQRGGRRDADPHPHVLLGVQRHHRGDRRHGRRRDFRRGVPLEDGAPRLVRRVRLPERDRAGRLRHPLPARAVGRGDGRPHPQGPRGARHRPDVGQPGLRPQDAPLGGGPTVARKHGPGRRECPRAGRGGLIRTPPALGLPSARSVRCGGVVVWMYFVSIPSPRAVGTRRSSHLHTRPKAD